MKVTIDYISIKIPIFRLKFDKQKCPQFPIADNVSVGSIVMTERGFDIGYVAEVSNGRPAKIFSRCDVFNYFTNYFPSYGGIESVKWYDTGIRMSLTGWIVLSRENTAGEFHKYWQKKLGII